MKGEFVQKNMKLKEHNIALSSVPWSSIVAQKLLKTRVGVTPLHRAMFFFMTVNVGIVVY